MVNEITSQKIEVGNLPELYEVDDYLWLQKTIDILIARDLDKLDLENLIEELKTLGKRNFNKVRSLLRQILIYLLFLEYWQQEYDRNHRHWQAEVITFRYDLVHSLTTTLFNKLNEDLENIYQVAAKLVTKKTNFPANIFPAHCPYSFDKILDGSCLP